MRTIAILFTLLTPALSLPAQDTSAIRKFVDCFYVEGQLGFFLADGYLAGTLHTGAGYRFDEQHSLGLALTTFGQGTESTSRGATGLGLQYRYRTNGWLWEAAGGRVLHFSYSGDDPFELRLRFDQSIPWYFRLGIQRHIGKVLTLGISYAQSGNFAVEVTDRESMPPRSYVDKDFGPQVFTINLGFLVK